MLSHEERIHGSFFALIIYRNNYYARHFIFCFWSNIFCNICNKKAVDNKLAQQLSLKVTMAEIKAMRWAAEKHLQWRSKCQDIDTTTTEAHA